MDDAKDGGGSSMDQSVERSRIVWVVFALTLFWFLAVPFLVFYTELPAGVGRWDLIQRLGAMQPSEVGDLLAGMFAPPAFMWLVATVIIQSQELSDQRKELRAANLAADRQAVAMAKQATSSEAQTRLLLEQANQQRADRSDAQANGTITAFANEIRYGGLNTLTVVDDDEYTDILAFTAVPNESEESCIARFRDQLREAQHEIFHHHLQAVPVYSARRWSNILNNLVADFEMMSPGTVQRLEAVGIEEIAGALRHWIFQKPTGDEGSEEGSECPSG